MHSARRAITLLLILSACVAGCTAGGRPIRFGDKVAPDSETPETVLRAKTSDYMFRFVNEIESELGEIVYETRGTAEAARYRERALITALRTNDLALQAGFDPDTVAALADLWVLTGQMRNFFRTGDGRDWFTPHQKELLESLTQLELQIARIGNDYLGQEYDEGASDPESLRGEFIDDLIRNNPIHGQGLVRTSASIEVAKFLGEQPRPNLFTAMEAINDNTATISYRLAALTHVMPKAMVWRADLLLNERLQEFQSGPLMTHIDRAATVAADLPELIDRERSAAMLDIDRQRTETLADVDRQRTETLDAIEHERTEIVAAAERLRTDTFADLDAMRVDTIDRVEERLTTALRDQTQSLVATIDHELEDTVGRTLAAAEEMRVATFTDGSAMLEATLDRFFWRVLLLIGIATLAGALLLLFAHRLRMRRLRLAPGGS